MLVKFPNLNEKAKQFLELSKDGELGMVWDRGVALDDIGTEFPGIFTIEELMEATFKLSRFRNPDYAISQASLEAHKEGSYLWVLMKRLQLKIEGDYKLAEKLEKVFLRGDIEDD